MSRSAKLYLLGGLVAVLIAVLAWQIQFSEVVAYMDSHNGFFAGIGALITAAATVVVAFFTKSTRDLFRLEAERRETGTAYVQGRIFTFLLMVRSISVILRTVLDTPPAQRSPTIFGAMMEQLEDSFSSFRQDLPRLLRASEGSPSLAEVLGKIQMVMKITEVVLPSSDQLTDPEQEEHFANGLSALLAIEIMLREEVTLSDAQEERLESVPAKMVELTQNWEGA